MTAEEARKVAENNSIKPILHNINIAAQMGKRFINLYDPLSAGCIQQLLELGYGVTPYSPNTVSRITW